MGNLNKILEESKKLRPQTEDKDIFRLFLENQSTELFRKCLENQSTNLYRQFLENMSPIERQPSNFEKYSKAKEISKYHNLTNNQ